MIFYFCLSCSWRAWILSFEAAIATDGVGIEARMVPLSSGDMSRVPYCMLDDE